MQGDKIIQILQKLKLNKYENKKMFNYSILNYLINQRKQIKLIREFSNINLKQICYDNK